MSSPATTFRLFYPDSNTVTALALYGPTGAILTPSSMVDGTGDPAGFKSKVLTFPAASEPIFATPTFADPNTPVGLYLTRDAAGTFRKVLDETVFDAADPGRPTPWGDRQQWLLYDAHDQGGGVTTYTVKAAVDPANPLPPVAIIKPLGNDPLTGEKRYGNEFLFRWQGRVPELAEIEVDVDDIIDPTGFFPIPVTNITTYAETSMGLSLVRANTPIIPQDGLSHLLLFRIRYNVNGDTGPYTNTPVYSASFAVPPPNPPASLTATLLRDRTGDVGDVVHFAWEKAALNGGDGIEIYTTTVLGKTHRLYQSNGVETSCRVDNVSRFVVREDESEVQPEPFGFHIVATNISGKSEPTNAAAPLQITPRLKPSRPPTPDELAGTAREVEYATLKAEVFADVLTALGALPPEGQGIVNSAVDQAFLKIKDVVRLGGSVQIADFGVLAAKWTNERLARNPATGAPIVVPPYRNLGFSPSLGFRDGTRAGTLLTDAQAKALRDGG